VCIVQVHVDKVVQQTVTRLVVIVVVVHVVTLVVLVVMAVDVEIIVVHRVKVSVM
jgi:hypothetical protein